MDKNNFTPASRSRKSLGVRRSITKSHLTPNSDVKKSNVIQFLKNDQLESPKTPMSGFKTLGISSRTRSSNSYKLSLNRTLKEQHKKKKLVFSAQDSNESTEMDISFHGNSPLRPLPQSPFRSKSLLDIEDTSFESIKNYELMNEDELKNEIGKKRKLLEDLKKHEEKVDELKKLIEVWKKGFRVSIADIKNEIKLHDNGSILERLCLPKELITYC